jgi:hypothetical protein
MYRTLDAEKIVTTLVQLERRITERFPGAGLARVCAELVIIAGQTRERSQEIARPRPGLRVAIALCVLGAAGVVVWIVARIVQSTRANDDLFGTIQGIDAGLNMAVLLAAGLFFLVSIEERFKRRRALKALHELRSIIHVIDMHQLTKDPMTDVEVSTPTPSSPKRTLTPYQLVRYLDYCSEMLSLTAKVAALYAQSLPDPVVTEAVNDIERIAASISQKIWQKINIQERALTGGAGAESGSIA